MFIIATAPNPLVVKLMTPAPNLRGSLCVLFVQVDLVQCLVTSDQVVPVRSGIGCPVR